MCILKRQMQSFMYLCEYETLKDDWLWSLQVMKQWERKVRSASSLDELLRLTDFPDWKLWKCRLRLQQPETQTETLSSPPSVGSHRSTRYAAESYSLEILKGWINHATLYTGVCLCVLMWLWTLCVLCLAIDEEWQRTQCMPRETCVDVAKELGTDPSMFFKPPCVSIHRFVYIRSTTLTLFTKLNTTANVKIMSIFDLCKPAEAH